MNSFLFICRERYEKIRDIGQGSYGKAILVQRRGTTRLCVIKQIRIQGLDEEEMEEVQAEARILASLDHPNIIRLMDDTIPEDGWLHIVTEYADRGDLYKIITMQSRKREYLAEAQILNWFMQVIFNFFWRVVERKTCVLVDYLTFSTYVFNGLGSHGRQAYSRPQYFASRHQITECVSHISGVI